MKYRYNLTLEGFRKAQDKNINNKRSMALFAIFVNLPRMFTKEDAERALRDVDLGSGTPSSFVTALIEAGYIGAKEWPFG